MALLDDLFSKKKETTPILDLSKANATTEEEFKKLLDKISEFKMKPEKVRSEDLKVRDKHFKFKSGKKDSKVLKQPYTFLDPIPPDMKSLNVEELAAIPIEWKMLTMIRPKTKTEEEYFSRLVELRKLQMKTASKDRRSYGVDPQIRRSKNKAGVPETRVVTCKECGDEFCTGEWCKQFSYDSFVRVPEENIRTPLKAASLDAGKGTNKAKKKIKRRSRSTAKPKTKKKGKSKSKSPEKSPSKPPIKPTSSRKSKSPRKAKSPEKRTTTSPRKIATSTLPSSSKKSSRNKK